MCPLGLYRRDLHSNGRSLRCSGLAIVFPEKVFRCQQFLNGREFRNAQQGRQQGGAVTCRVQWLSFLARARRKMRDVPIARQRLRPFRPLPE